MQTITQKTENIFIPSPTTNDAPKTTIAINPSPPKITTTNPTTNVITQPASAINSIPPDEPQKDNSLILIVFGIIIFGIIGGIVLTQFL